MNTTNNEVASVQSEKRKDYLKWMDYFMAMAFLSAKRSKDPNTQVGACIVNSRNRIIGIGYNGFPNGCNDDNFPWGKSDQNPLNNKYMFVCHAELNAILNSNIGNVQDCIIYSTLFPCNECAKVIIQAGIHEVIYSSDKNSHTSAAVASRQMFDAAGITYRQYLPKTKSIILNLTGDDDIESNILPNSSTEHSLPDNSIEKKLENLTV